MADQTKDQKTNIPDGAKTVPPKNKTSGNKILIIIGIVVVVLFVIPGVILAVFFGWLASGNNVENLTESIVERTTGNEIDINSNDGSFSINTDEGSVEVGGDQTLPSDLPEEVVVFNNQEIIGVFTSAEDGNKFWSITAETNSPVDSANSFIVKGYADKGWTTESTSTFNTSSTYTYSNDDLEAVVTISPTDESTVSITYYVTQKAN
jgi:hypothetical protein